MMSFLEAVVDIFGDLWGITGAFLCIKGMGEVFVGIEGGICLVYHVDLGWAAYIWWNHSWSYDWRRSQMTIYFPRSLDGVLVSDQERDLASHGLLHITKGLRVG